MRYNLPDSTWRKSSYSGDNGAGNCVEFQLTPEGTIALGDSKDRSQGAFEFTPAEWTAFVDGVRNGEFDIV